MTRLAFFVGKGGVGKTTLSAAYALWLANERKRAKVLLVSTDPAHSLADILRQPLGRTKTRVKAGPANLRAWQISASKEFNAFLAENREPMLRLVEQGTIFTRAEIEPFLDSALPGMAELSALLALAGILESGDYDHVVVDTAPFGHTLRLFQLPEQFEKLLAFLDAAMRRDQSLAAHFGGRVQRPAASFLERWRTLFAQMHALLRSHATETLLVTSPERFALEQTRRIAAHLEELEMRVSRMLLNRVTSSTGSCAACSHRKTESETAKRFIRRKLGSIPLLSAEDPGFPIIGVEALQALGDRVFGKGQRALREPRRPATAPIRFAKLRWPADKQQLSFTLGKGGVGKTTISAGLAFTARKRSPGKRVTVCSTDPSPSLDEVFQQAIGNEAVSVLGDRKLHAIEIDSLAEYKAFSSGLKRSLNRGLSIQQGGLHVELSQEQEVLNALLDIMPPGVDELLGIMRISSILEQAAISPQRSAQPRADAKARVPMERPQQGSATSAATGQTLIVDMAPTGHALELLRTPERILHWSRLLMKILAANRNLAIAQDVAVEVADLSQRLRALLGTMRDPERCRIIVVLLAEPLPDRETRRLLRELQELRLPVHAVYVNRVHFSAQPRCRRCTSAGHWQRATLYGLMREIQAPLYAVPDFAQHIEGKTGLVRLTKEIWRIQAAKGKRP